MSDETHGGGEGDAAGELPPGLLHELRTAYHDPPPAPAEEMWSEVEAAMGFRGGGGRSVRPGAPPARPARGKERPSFLRATPVALGAAAVFLVGLALGRLTGESDVTPPEGSEALGVLTRELPDAPTDPAGPSGLPQESWVRSMAAPHLDEAEFFLSFVGADLRASEAADAPVGEDVARWAESLLGQTRSLLEAPAVAEDPELRRLLEDLELVLVQVAHVPDEGAAEEERRVELELIAQGLEEKELLSRLQVAAANRGETLPEEGP